VGREDRGALDSGMAGPARKPATYDDLLKLPDDRIGEIVDGELYANPRPAGRHATCAFTLSTELGPPFQARRGGPGGWLFLFEPELHLANDTLVPDLAGWRRERLPSVPDAPAMTLAPDWVCEILSSSTERLDRVRKLPAYARHGVGHAWLINPSTRTLEVYRREGGSWVLAATHADDALVRAEPFDAIEIDLLRLWGEERPPSAG
jgi:Uma2 family endonuclease